MEFTAKQIAEFLGGRIEGDENAKVSTFCKIDNGKSGAITFLANPKYAHFIYNTEASIVLVNEDLHLDQEVDATLIRVADAYASVSALLRLYDSMKPKKKGIDKLAFISSSAQVGNDCYVGGFAYIGENVEIGERCLIYPHAYIGDGVKLGDDCIIYPNVSIYYGCRLGNRVTIHSGSVIGADGFGFAPEGDGYKKIPQLGIVIIEDDVEIGANSCVDRSTMEATIVHKGVKLDNLVQIAHNTEIGANTVMSAQVGIAGSTKVGEWCMFGGQVGIAGHITIGDKVMLGAQSGVPSSLKSNQRLIGTPPMPETPYFKSMAIFRRLPDLYKQIDQLQKEIEELKQNR